MKIAIAGKGGSGKTTIGGTLARLLARGGLSDVLAIDADSNPNLALTLGLSREASQQLRPLTRDILKRVTGEDGEQRTVLAKTPAAVVDEYGVQTPDGVMLLLMGRVEHAGAG
ncbi:MAG TPA: AAA family ATPase [Thermoanaerobaculia bacterium]|nr:AAA family ATPase [Thermoanaerobaculia bacterium]